MSNEYDNEIFDRSVQGSYDFEIPVKQVQRYEITDSNLGNYSSGQVKFNLSQLATSSSYIDFKKSHLVIPITLSLATSNAAGTAAFTHTDIVTHFYATLKNSFTTLIDSLVFSINNVECVSKTGSLLNIPLMFNMMTSFDRSDVDSLGASMGFVPDSAESFKWSATLGETNNELDANFQATLNNNRTVNTGRVMRHYKTVQSLLDDVTRNFYNANRMNTAHKSYSQMTAQRIENYIECVIPLRYVHDIFSELPLMRGSSVQLLVNTHCPSRFSFSTVAAGTSADSGVAMTTSSPNSFLPFMVSKPSAALNAAIDQVLTAECRIGCVFNTQCQLRLSLCDLNPEFEQRLIKSPVKPIRYRDWYCFPNQTTNVAGGTSVNTMLNINIPKLRRLLIIPKIAVNSTTRPEISDVYQSAFSSSGCTTTPALLSNLQVFLSGKPVYQTPMSYTWEQFLIELEGSNGVSGNINDGLRVGLIDKQLYESVYGYVLVNLSRKDSADDAIEKSIQISFQNNNSVAMSYSYFVEYERGFELDVVSGKIQV